MQILEEAHETAVHSATAFAGSTSAWILDEIDHSHLLNRVLDVMLQSGTMFVQIVKGNVLVVDSRAPGWELRALTPPPEALGVTDYVRYHDKPVLDTLVPITEDNPSAGWVRIGIDATYLGPQFRNARLSTSLFALGLWLAVLLFGALFPSVRGAFIRPSPQSASSIRPEVEAPADQQETRLATFPLIIDSRSKHAIFQDRELSLSPKPFLLLELLSQECGRVFNDREIIAHVWADSSYVNGNDVRQCVYRLRRRLNKIEHGLGDCITNVKGFGYRFDGSKLDLQD